MRFEELVTKISPKLKGIVHKLNGRFTFFNEDDLYQEAMVHLWLAYKNGKLGDKADSYILQGCYFHLKNYIRQVQDKAYLISIDTLINEKETSPLEKIMCLENPKSCYDDINNKILIEEILNNNLTKTEKKVFSLCWKGLTTREIGKILSVSHTRVVKLRNRIKFKSQKFKDFI